MMQPNLKKNLMRRQVFAFASQLRHLTYYANFVVGVYSRRCTVHDLLSRCHIHNMVSSPRKANILKETPAFCCRLF